MAVIAGQMLARRMLMDGAVVCAVMPIDFSIGSGSSLV